MTVKMQEEEKGDHSDWYLRPQWLPIICQSALALTH